MVEHQPTSCLFSLHYLSFLSSSSFFLWETVKTKQADVLMRVTAPLKHAHMTHSGNTPRSNKYWEIMLACWIMPTDSNTHKHTLDKDGWQVTLFFSFLSDCRTISLPAVQRGCRIWSPQWTCSPVSLSSEWRYRYFFSLPMSKKNNMKSKFYTFGVQNINLKM